MTPFVRRHEQKTIVHVYDPEGDLATDTAIQVAREHLTGHLDAPDPDSCYITADRIAANWVEVVFDE